MSNSLRERQAPLKARYEAEPELAKLTITIRSGTVGDDPTRVRVQTDSADAKSLGVWDVGAHPMAGGGGDLACSGDLLLGSLAACQEITLRMVAAAMGIALESVEVVVEGDLDFRGAMGVDLETPVGFTAIRTSIRIEADAPADRLERFAQRAERFCVMAATLRESPKLTTVIETAQPREIPASSKARDNTRYDVVAAASGS